MGFKVVDRQPGGNSGKLSIGLTGEAVEIWTVVADNYNYTTEDLRNAGLFPEAYTTFHAQNNRLRMQPVDVQQDKDDPSLFICTLTWTSEKFDPSKEDEKEDSPLDRTAKIKVKTGRMTETSHRDFYGKPKVNKAGDLFDPPIESNVSFKIINIRKNVTVFPDWVFDFDNSTNIVPFTIKGRTFAKGCVYMANVELDEPNTDGPIAYCEARLELWVKKRRKPGPGESPTDVPDPWQTEQLNEGLFALVAVVPFTGAYKKVRCKVADADDPTKTVDSPGPVLLNDDGTQLPPLTPSTFDRAKFVVFSDMEYLDFNDLNYLWSDA